MPKLILLFVLVLSGALSFGCGSTTSSPPVSQKPRTVLRDFVVDNASLFSEQEKQQLSAKLGKYKKDNDVQILILTSPQIPDQGMAEFATAKGREYGNADKDTGYGIILVICVADKVAKSFLGPTANLEWFLTDGTAGQIQRQYLVPKLHKRQWYVGVNDTVDAIINQITPGVIQEREQQKERIREKRK